MTSLEITDSPFERVLSAEPSTAFSWTGQLSLTTSNKNIDGGGTVTVDNYAMRGTVEFDDTEAWRKAAETGPVEFGWSDEVAPGILVGPGRIGQAAPAENDDWNAEGCGIDGQAGLFTGELRFSIGEITVKGPAHGADAAFLRFIWSAAHIKDPPHISRWRKGTAEGYKRDRVDGTFCGRACTMRNLDVLYGQDPALCAVVVRADISKEQSHALWLLASFVAGRRLRQTAMERYDKDGILIERRFLSGVPSSIGAFPPFQAFVAPFRGEYLEVIGSGILRMIHAGFPIDVIIHHLHNSNEGNPETDAQSLLLAIHTAIEAWNRWFGVRTLVDDEVFALLRDGLLHLVEPMFDTLGPELAETVKNKIRSANHTSTGFRERDLMSSLGIVVGKAEKRALATRNKLLHDGYFLRRWDDLTPAERQERIDDGGLLKNVVHAIILHLVGFSGGIVEATRYHALPITSTFSPLFTART